VPFPNPKSQFKRGQSGNPAGYSRGRRATDTLLALIDEVGADKAIAKRWLKSILDGDFRYFKEYLERVEGPAAGTDGGGEDHPLVESLRKIAGGRKPKRPKKGR